MTENGAAALPMVEVPRLPLARIESLVLEVYRNTTAELAAKAGAAMK
jgi:hypothetical protein